MPISFQLTTISSVVNYLLRMLQAWAYPADFQEYNLRTDPFGKRWTSLNARWTYRAWYLQKLSSQTPHSVMSKRSTFTTYRHHFDFDCHMPLADFTLQLELLEYRFGGKMWRFLPGCQPLLPKKWKVRKRSPKVPKITKRTNGSGHLSWKQGRIWLVFDDNMKFCLVCKEAATVHVMVSHKTVLPPVKVHKAAGGIAYSQIGKRFYSCKEPSMWNTSCEILLNAL